MCVWGCVYIPHTWTHVLILCIYRPHQDSNTILAESDYPNNIKGATYLGWKYLLVFFDSCFLFACLCLYYDLQGNPKPWFSPDRARLDQNVCKNIFGFGLGNAVLGKFRLGKFYQGMQNFFPRTLFLWHGRTEHQKQRQNSLEAADKVAPSYPWLVHFILLLCITSLQDVFNCVASQNWLILGLIINCFSMVQAEDNRVHPGSCNNIYTFPVRSGSGQNITGQYWG